MAHLKLTPMKKVAILLETDPNPVKSIDFIKKNLGN